MTPKRRDLIINQLGGGSIAEKLVLADMDPGVLRPFVGEDGNSYVTMGAGTPDERVLTTNSPAVLDRQDWETIDRDVAWQAKLRLNFADDVFAANTVTVPGGWGVLSLRHKVGDSDADAILVMDPIEDSERSKPISDTAATPLPIWVSDGSFSARELATSRRSNMPLDTVGLRAGARKISENIEQCFLGTLGSYEFAHGTLYGATNHPNINLYTMTSPENGGWTPKTTIDQVLQMIRLLETKKFYGPFNLYYSLGWGPFFGGDYNANYGGVTLLQRLQNASPKINKIVPVDYLSDFTMLLIQMTGDVIEGINFLPLTTVQWSEHAGMNLRFKMMTGKVPRIRANYAGHTGIVKATATAPTTTTTSTTTTTTTTTP